MSNAVSKKKNAEVIPFNKMFEEDSNKGFETVDNQDTATPRLKVLQPLSEEKKELGATEGDIFNDVSRETFKGEEGVTVIPCGYVRQYVEWVDRGKGSTGAPVNIYDASSDIITKTKRDGSKDRLPNGNYVETCGNHYVLLVKDDLAEPCVITMKSTALKKSRKWNTMMKSLKINGQNGPFTPPMFSKFYKLKTVREENDQGLWYNWDITAGDFLSDKDKNLYAMAKDFSNFVSDGTATVKHEQDVEKQSSPY